MFCIIYKIGSIKNLTGMHYRSSSSNLSGKDRTEYIIRYDRNGNMSNVFSNRKLPECVKNKDLMDFLNTWFDSNPDICFVEFYAYE